MGPVTVLGALLPRAAPTRADSPTIPILYMMLPDQKSGVRPAERKVIPSAKMVPMGLDSMLHFSGHLEPSSIDVRAKQSFSFSSQNWPHGSRAETRRENDAKSRYEV